LLGDLRDGTWDEVLGAPQGAVDSHWKRSLGDNDKKSGNL
jgi:hypothetical protein